MKPTFRGFGISGYRSFGSEMQFIGPTMKVNLVAGRNNVGKSNIIRFATQHLSSFRLWLPSGLDRPRDDRHASYSVALCLPTVTDLVGNVLSESSITEADLQPLMSAAALQIAPGTDSAWIRFAPNPDGSGSTILDLQQAERLLTEIGGEPVSKLAGKVSNTTGGARYDDWGRFVEYLLARVAFPPVAYIDAFRQIRVGKVDGHADYTGAGLVEEIAELQNPEAMDQPSADRKYEAINEFISAVLGEPAKLQVPHSKNTVNVRMRGNVVLPLDHQGTGLHQLMIIATAATVLEGQLVCIEEPEINLHPTLQRALLRYLSDHTTNTYLISTHSAQMLDFERSNVVHVEHGPSGTIVTPATRPADAARVCFDLGYRPSDLLQANAVMWVEGPSDRTYLNFWISKIAPHLVEGVHYSVMFYGGALLSELAFDDPEVTDFIKLRRLNRHLGVLMDRDRVTKSAPLNDTKNRVCAEFASAGEDGLVWVVDGYTIENYVPVEVLRSAVADVHPGRTITWNGTRWSKPFGGFAVPGNTTRPKKAPIAKRAIARWSDPLSQDDLRENVERVVRFIERANLE